MSKMVNSSVFVIVVVLVMWISELGRVGDADVTEGRDALVTHNLLTKPSQVAFHTHNVTNPTDFLDTVLNGANKDERPQCEI